jgi:hypothetical protein
MSVERRQTKAIRRLSKLLPQGTVTQAYGAGRANARMTTAAAGIIIGFAILYALVAVLTRLLLIPGLPVFIVLLVAIRPMRGLAVTDTGIVVVAVSAWRGQPKTVLGQGPFASISSTNIRRVRKKVVRVTLGTDVVRLRVRDYERLRAAVDAQGQASSEPGWYPVEDDQYRRGYWSGTSWTDYVRWDGTAWAETARPSGS